MKQQANKSFFGLKWLAVLIATLLLVGTFARVSTVNAETQLKDITKMKILGSYNEKIDFVDGEDYNQTVTIKLTYNNPQYSEVKVPVQIKNLPTGKGGIRLSVYRDTDNSLWLLTFVETAIDHNVIDYQQIPIEDGKVTKVLQYTATDENRTKFLEDLANAKEKGETTTAEQASNSNEKSSNSSDSKGNAKGSESKDIFDKIDNFFDQLDTDKIGEGVGKGVFYIVIILVVFFGIKGKQNKARKNNRRARTGNTRSAQRVAANAPATRAQGTSTPVVATEAVPQRVYRPRNKVSDPKLRSQAKKQATKQALQSASSRSNTSREMYVDTRATRPVSYRPASKEKSHTLPRVLSSKTLPRTLKTPRLK
ncbi:hypothetical protein [Streptococcus sp. 263_SSPC]|uniref:hypothetical protein n=1 Tax=Streptococcus sp. 263_SSPC TaxID=1579343 RepID=UPI0006617D87|nr:hypothetical protein [Streptococcus sp. 263_SSPC]